VTARSLRHTWCDRATTDPFSAFRSAIERGEPDATVALFTADCRAARRLTKTVRSLRRPVHGDY
jgi:hypothetical protein